MEKSRIVGFAEGQVWEGRKITLVFVDTTEASIIGLPTENGRE